MNTAEWLILLVSPFFIRALLTVRTRDQNGEGGGTTVAAQGRIASLRRLSTRGS